MERERAMASTLRILVTGATGQQGGSVARALLARGHQVRAFTRKPEGAAAKQLAKAGAVIAAGDLADPESLIGAAKGVDTVFLMGNSWEAGPDAERAQVIAAVDALARIGVGHVIYSSVDSADRNTGIPHFASKYAVERHLAASGLPYTISAPAAFMDNLVAPWMIDGLRNGVLAMALPAERKLKQLAVADIGAFVASLAERREAVFGRRYDIAGDAVSGAEAAAILSRVTQRDIRYQELPLESVQQQSADLAAMFEWFDRVGYNADIPALKREFHEVNWHSFQDWARTFDWSVLERRPAESRAAAQ
jgi:uncharacterized protein YbjT (DUF2867 family)